MMKRLSILAAAAAIPLASPAAAQELQPETRTAVAPVAPPAVVVTRTAPGVFHVDALPGIAAAVPVKVQRFGDYDRNNDGLYSPSEFAQAMYFLATGDPALGDPTLPRTDRNMHKGAPLPLRPELAVELLNATSDEFVMADANRDMRISPAELAAVAAM
jgi:hypothetical protein